MDECVFCKIVRGELGTRLVAENDMAIAFDDIQPLAPVHTLVVPRVHIASLHEASLEDSSVLAGCLLLANQVADQKGISEGGYRVVTNVGNHSGQTVFHLHFHVVGGQRLGTGV